MQVSLKRIVNETSTVRTFWFETESRLNYIAGQFIELILPGKSENISELKRWFTLSSSPTEELLAITTRFDPARSSLFKQRLNGIKIGQRLEMSQPMGDFVLPKDTSTPVVFIAAGMGITPVRSIAKWLKDTGEARDISVIYAVRSHEDILFMDTVKEVSKIHSFMSGAGKRLTGDEVLKLVPNTGNNQYFVSGPELFVESVINQLSDLGIDENRLIGDYYPGYSF